MRSRTCVVVGARRLERLDTRPPLTVRRVQSDDPDEVALCVVGSAAGPLAGDDVTLELIVRDRARVRLIATGAGLAQGGGGGRRVHTCVTVGRESALVGHPQPIVAATGSRLDVHVSLRMEPTSTVQWHELVVLGRTGEPPGAATLHWDVTRGERPVLRQLVDLTEPLRDWRGMLDGRRVLATSLLTGPALMARTVVAAPHAVAAALDDHTALVTVLGDDVANVRASVDSLCAAAVAHPPTR